MEFFREVEKSFDTKRKSSFDPSKRVGSYDYEPEYKPKAYDPSKRIVIEDDIEAKETESKRVESVGSNKLDYTKFITKLISTLDQFGHVEIDGNDDGVITGIRFSTRECPVYVNLTDFPSVKVGARSYFAETSALGVLELALYIAYVVHNTNRKYNDELHKIILESIKENK